MSEGDGALTAAHLLGARAETAGLRAVIAELERRASDERIERRRAEAERDRLRAELDAAYAGQETAVAEMVASQVADLLDAAQVDGWARDEVAELRAQVSRLREALAFAQSVIKSGERWSPTCDEVIGGALAASEEGEK